MRIARYIRPVFNADCMSFYSVTISLNYVTTEYRNDVISRHYSKTMGRNLLKLDQTPANLQILIYELIPSLY